MLTVALLLPNMIRPDSYLRPRGAMRALLPRAGCHFSRSLRLGSQRRGLQWSVPHRADEKPQSFKHQLYESTQQRLKRERAEQERYSQFQSQSQGSRNVALMLGMPIARGPPHEHLWISRDLDC